MAVSGGVDSMALAAILHRHQRIFGGFDMQAVIVDHQLRNTSTEEAQRTSSILANLGTH